MHCYVIYRIDWTCPPYLKYSDHDGTDKKMEEKLSKLKIAQTNCKKKNEGGVDHWKCDSSSPGKKRLAGVKS